MLLLSSPEWPLLCSGGGLSSRAAALEARTAPLCQLSDYHDAQCAMLRVSPSWVNGVVPTAALPSAPTDERDWLAFRVAQILALRTANGRTTDAIGIV